MPDNPDVTDLVAHAVKLTEAQAKLRAAMATVAKEIAAQRLSMAGVPAKPEKTA